MTQSTGTEKKSWGNWFWNFIDNIEGDKVVWIVVLLLMLISILAIFSSTPLLDDGGKTRIDIIREQIFVVAGGLVTIWCIYKSDALKINTIKHFMNVSQFGFILALIPLVILALHLNLGFVKAQYINHAWRTLSIMGFQFHTFEWAKITMVMYIAWACHTYKIDQEQIANGEKLTKFRFANTLSKKPNFAFLKKPFWKRVFYMYAPIGIISLLVFLGSGSSGIFIGTILMLTLFIGGVPWKEVLIGISTAAFILFIGFSTYKISDGKMLKIFDRLPTMISRFNTEYTTEKLATTKIRSADFYKERDKILQPYGAKIAIHEGKMLGKGSGNSTQKYIVTNIYGDYMYSFLIEEYGLIGGIIIIILYVSLLARGSQIAKMCKKEFTKIAVGGLTLLITGQAFMHMYVNVDIGPMTGQTLPLVSHGAFAFLMFCIAFGIILTISKLTKNQMRQAEAMAKPLYERENEVDDIQASMDILDKLDSDEPGCLNDDI